MHAHVKKCLTIEFYLVYFFVKEGIEMSKIRSLVIGLILATMETAAFLPMWWLLVPVHIYYLVLFSIIVPAILFVVNPVCLVLASCYTDKEDKDDD